jgi:molecular chaperone DnaK (HSP70)
MIIGIDLGTTFSVIAVKGKVQLVDGYPEAQYLEQCDVSIIPDPSGNLIIPSALWLDPDQPGRYIVGSDAKEQAENGNTPIQFSKRNIGTNIEMALGDENMTARQAAAQILMYLKSVAEQALGKPVTQAVVTHPAYFDAAMCEETALAAKDAGFDFDPQKHLLMEPIAAALAYTQTNTRDPLRILTYDLGGGTFDVTVMERRGGIFTIKAFGGNRLLGGFNFDRELALWLLKRMQERGVKVTVDDATPEHRARWAQLMAVAERTKIALAEAGTDEKVINVKKQAIFKDDLGRSITLQDQINRATFEGLIQEMLDGTIDGRGGENETKGCNAVLAQAGMSVDQLDEIILVGGSSYGPWVNKVIKKHWNRDAELFEPDLCVAAGAAIHSAGLPQEIEGAHCRVILDVPASTSLLEVNVAGRVQATGQAALPARLQVILSDQILGSRWQVAPQANGAFLFENVPLQPETGNEFRLQVCDDARRKLAEHTFTVAQDPESSSAAVLFVIPKPLYVEVLEGLQPLAEEGKSLPAHCEVTLARTNDDDVIEINLYQENNKIGIVAISNVPKEAVGGKIKLCLDITRENRITGQASVFTRRGVEVAGAVVDVRIPPMQVPSVADLREQLKELAGQLQEKLDLEKSAEERMKLSAKGSKAAQKAQDALDRPLPDAQEAWLAQRELNRLLHPEVIEMDPPLDDFNRMVNDMKDTIQNSSDPQIKAQKGNLDRLETQGRGAYESKDAKKWGQTYAQLIDLYHKIHQKDDNELPPTPVLKAYAAQQVDQTRQALRDREGEGDRAGHLTARWQQRIQQIDDALTDAEVAIDQIDDELESQAAWSKISVVLTQKVKKAEKEIPMLFIDVVGSGIR